MATNKESSIDPENLKVEDGIKSLENYVEALEQGEIGLDEGFEIFEKAVKVSKALKVKLDSYERKIEILTGVDSEGNPTTEKFE